MYTAEQKVRALLETVAPLSLHQKALLSSLLQRNGWTAVVMLQPSACAFLQGASLLMMMCMQQELLILSELRVCLHTTGGEPQSSLCRSRANLVRVIFQHPFATEAIHLHLHLLLLWMLHERHAVPRFTISDAAHAPPQDAELTTTFVLLQELPCGHFMHSHCFAQYTRYNYTCPVCSKTMGDMSMYFRMIDSLVARTDDLPAGYACRKQVSIHPPVIYPSSLPSTISPSM